MDDNAPTASESTPPPVDNTQPQGAQATSDGVQPMAMGVNSPPPVDKDTSPSSIAPAMDANSPPQVEQDTSPSQSSIASKKKYIPKAKADRLTRRGWADGWRAEWLSSMLLGYRRVAGDPDAESEYLETVYRQYFVKVPWTIPDEEEPPFPVNEWRPDVPMPVESLTDEQMVAKRAIVTERKQSIKRWLQYRVQYVPLASAGGMGRRCALDSPYAILWAKLSGTAKPGKARQSFQEWQVAHKVELQAVIDAKWQKAKETGAATGKQGAGFRQNIARQMFAKLSDEEKARWAERAKSAAVEAKAEFKRVIEEPPSKDPAVRAKCIAGLPAFLQPIAEMVGAITGLQLIVHAAGPMPQYNGEVNVITVSSSKNLETPASTVTKWNSKKFLRYKEYLVDYVHTCYTDEELEAAKLPSNGGGNMSGGPDDMEYDLSALLFDDEDGGGKDDDNDDEESEDHEVLAGGAAGATQKGGKKRGHAGRSDGPRKKRATGKENTSHAQTPRTSHAQTSRPVKALPKKAASPMTANNAVPHIAAPPMPNSSSIPESPPIPDAEAPGGEKGATDESDDDEEEEIVFGPRLPTYEERRDSNIATIKLMPEYIAAFGASQELTATLEKPRPKPRPRSAKAKAVEALPLRRSTRRNFGEGVPGGEGEDMATTKDIGASSDHSPDVEMSGNQDLNVGMDSGQPHDEETGMSGGVNNDMDVDVQPGGNIESNGNARSVVPSALDDVEVEERAEEVEEALVDAKDWFKSSYAFFEDVVKTLGPRWRRLLDRFVLLEAGDEFSGKGSLTVDGRPVLLSKWIKQGRLTKKRTMPTDLDVANIAEFKRQFRVWYDSLQPDWREKLDGDWTQPKLGRKKLDWGALDVRGVCGLLSVVACLYWWGLVAADMTQSEFTEWEGVVDDVSWVLEKIRVN